mgnify:CR=1 FL=1
MCRQQNLAPGHSLQQLPTLEATEILLAVCFFLPRLVAQTGESKFELDLPKHFSGRSHNPVIQRQEAKVYGVYADNPRLQFHVSQKAAIKIHSSPC